MTYRHERFACTYGKQNPCIRSTTIMPQAKGLLATSLYLNNRDCFSLSSVRTKYNRSICELACVLVTLLESAL